MTAGSVSSWPDFVLRVDDVGQDVEQSQKDEGLKTFRRWLDASQLSNYPIYLGVVPEKLDKEELAYLFNLQQTTKVKLCIHGWDHTYGMLRPSHIKKAFDVLGSNIVIAPYNKYNGSTLETIASLPTTTHPPVLLGGFHGKDHEYGPNPKILAFNNRSLIHVSATDSLYNKSWEVAKQITSLFSMIENVKKIGHDPTTEPFVTYPLQIVLHHRWEAYELARTTNIAPIITPYLVGVEQVWKYLNRSQP